MVTGMLLFSSVSYGKPQGHTYQHESKITGGESGTTTYIVITQFHYDVPDMVNPDVPEYGVQEPVGELCDGYATDVMHPPLSENRLIPIASWRC